ncbi:MAG: sugar phosphate isomerase/epimerase [Planctomycetes bacterium]|nr:sugar phosphate isomerase/epimerase [Planctomycetota bacterium]
MSAPLWKPGYCTSGLVCHGLGDALALLRDEGYRAVVITPDAAHLDPRRDDYAAEVRRTATQLATLDLDCIVETGSRFLLDPRRKHWPTLLDDGGPATVRSAFLRDCMQLARQLGARCVSLWSGVLPENMPPQRAWQRLRERLLPLLDAAASDGLVLGFEPEPGMLVATVADWHELHQLCGAHPALRMSLDCGHIIANNEGVPHEVLLRERAHLAWVAIEDMRYGVHEHLPFGEGDLDLPALLAALAQIGFDGVVAVELPRHAHAGATMVRSCRKILAAHGAPFRQLA